MTDQADKPMEEVWVKQDRKSMSILLIGPSSRGLARHWIAQAPDGMMLTISETPRSEEQSERFWAACSTLAKSSVEWAGKRRTKDQWRWLLTSAWLIARGQEGELIEGLEGEPVHLLPAASTKRMTKSEMASLYDYVNAWCASQGVELME